jgi:Acyclic terpene utilisation family protein AtuA
MTGMAGWEYAAMADVLRIANCSGFYGDRFGAAREMVQGGPIDVLTGEYLAELTMLILWRTRESGRGEGWANTFLAQMEEILGTCAERGIKVVANAGGLNPAGLAVRLRALAEHVGIDASVAHVEGDDLMGRLGEVGIDGSPVTANAYLGGFGIAEALRGGADVVVTGRVTDASLVVGPGAWRFGWERTDHDRIAGAIVAGHAIECGPQVTGGNYAFFEEVPGLERPGFPIAELAQDGSSVITKHDGTGGLVSVGTVTAQLLYEIGGPRYLNPDAVARFDTIALEQAGPDRVRIAGVRGEPPPATSKVSVNEVAGWRNSVTLAVNGLDIEGKAALVERTLRASLGDVDDLRFRVEDENGLLTITARDADRGRVGRAFSSAVIELALASYPGFHATAPPGEARPDAAFRAAYVAAGALEERVVSGDGRVVTIGPAPREGEAVQVPPPRPAAAPAGPTRRAPLGLVAGARSGDKGGDANVGVWARTDAAFAWLDAFLTVERLAALVPEAAPLEVERHPLPNLRAINFVVKGLLGEGVASSDRSDPQAKGLGEYLRAREVEIPEAVLGSA